MELEASRKQRVIRFLSNDIAQVLEQFLTKTAIRVSTGLALPGTRSGIANGPRKTNDSAGSARETNGR